MTDPTPPKGRGGARPNAGRKPKSAEAKRRSTSANLPDRTVRLLDDLAARAGGRRSRSDVIVFAVELLEQASHTLAERDAAAGWDDFAKTARLLLGTFLEGKEFS